MVTWFLIAITVLLSMWALQRPRVLHRLLLYPYAMQRRGQYYRLISYAGVHADGVAKVKNALGTATLPVAISDKVARGCAWVESGYGATAALLSGNVEVSRA